MLSFPGSLKIYLALEPADRSAGSNAEKFQWPLADR